MGANELEFLTLFNLTHEPECCKWHGKNGKAVNP